MHARTLRWLLLFAVGVTTATAGESLLSNDVALYLRKVTAARAGESSAALRSYLDACVANVGQNLSGLETHSPGVNAAFAKVIQQRFLDVENLPAMPEGFPPSITAEDGAYKRHLAPYRYATYLPLLGLQEQLLERKYFKTQTTKQANFLEGYVNGRLPLTRAVIAERDIKEILDSDPTLGVSPWEAIFRLEPTLAFRGGPQAAIMGAAGLSHTFFPRVVRAGGATSFVETPASAILAKAGARLGVGGARLDGKNRFVFGPGVQVNAFALWALYEPKRGAWSLGVSTADLSQVKKAFAWFD